MEKIIEAQRRFDTPTKPKQARTDRLRQLIATIESPTATQDLAEMKGNIINSLIQAGFIVQNTED